MVFVKKSAKSKPGFNLGIIMDKVPTKGDVGIEIEVEGRNLPASANLVEPWCRKEDHSLRGQENAEYVIRAPIPFDNVSGDLDRLWGIFKECKTKFDESNRTSVHVHLNVQSWHLNRLTTFLGMYYCLEEILTEWCGEHRVGNLFCLRAKDAPAIIQYIRAFIRNDGHVVLQENLHYSGLNLHALRKFGSLEIRTLRGVSNPDVIKDWIEILRRLYELSKDYPDPRMFVDQFSAIGPLQLFDELLGGQASKVRSVISMTDEDVRESMYEGIRLAQDVCYCRDWSNFQTMDINPDPFGRKLKKVASRLVGANNQTDEGVSQSPGAAGPGSFTIAVHMPDDDEFDGDMEPDMEPMGPDETEPFMTNASFDGWNN